MSIATATDLARAAHLFHALSDETRLAVLELLRSGERCVCELQDALDVAQSRLSFHLKVLKEAGLVVDRREGRWAYYTLQRTALGEAQEAIGALGTEMPRSFQPPSVTPRATRPARALRVIGSTLESCCE